LKQQCDFIDFDIKSGKYFIIEQSKAVDLLNPVVNELMTDDDGPLPVPECSCLCGNMSTGNLKVTEWISLPVCNSCRDRLDPKHHWVFVHFDK
jgi:hypothetical protein